MANKIQPGTVEQRTLAAEVRAVGSAFALAGMAAAYGTISSDVGGFVETIQHGAFTRSLNAKADVVCTFNHDPNHVLGRTKSGTLTLTDSADGLLFYCSLDKKNLDHQNIYNSVKRGDINQCSFAFTIPKGGDKWQARATGTLRTLLDVDLKDVAVVTYPAYPTGTNVDARQAQYRTSVSLDTLVMRQRLDNLIGDSNRRSRLHAITMAMKNERK